MLFLFLIILSMNLNRNSTTASLHPSTSQQIAAGFNHGAFISNGTLFAFGQHIFGQLGIGNKIYIPYPTLLKSVIEPVKLITHSSHTLLVTGNLEKIN